MPTVQESDGIITVTIFPRRTDPSVLRGGERPLTAQVDDDRTLIYTMRELNQHTAQIMSEINKTGKPAFITRHGRFVAIISPVPPGGIESRILSEMAREIGKQDQD